MINEFCTDKVLFNFHDGCHVGILGRVENKYFQNYGESIGALVVGHSTSLKGYGLNRDRVK